MAPAAGDQLPLLGPPAAALQPEDAGAHSTAGNGVQSGNGVQPGGNAAGSPKLPRIAAARSQPIPLASAPSTPPQKLTPTVGFNASQADKDSASAYAVTALADATDIAAGNGDLGSGSGQQSPALAAADRNGSAATPVDWQRVAEQADPLPSAAMAHPAGSVARLRAIFEQQTRCLLVTSMLCPCRFAQRQLQQLAVMMHAPSLDDFTCWRAADTLQ